MTNETLEGLQAELSDIATAQSRFGFRGRLPTLVAAITNATNCESAVDFAANLREAIGETRTLLAELREIEERAKTSGRHQPWGPEYR